MKKIICITISFISFLFLSLSQSSLASEKSQQNNTAIKQPILVLLDWFENPNHAPLIVAEESGFFKKYHLNVKLIGPADPADPPKLVAAGKADIAITYEPHFMVQVSQGLPLTVIGTLVNQPLDSLAVLKDNDGQTIHSLKELKGKRVGYSAGGLNSIMLKTMLANVGLKLSDIEHINVHYNLTQALLSKKVDAVTGVMRTLEPIQLALAGHPATLFFPEKYGVPDYSELIYVVNKNKKNDPRWPLFLAAVKEATKYLRAHPEATWQTFAKNHPEQNNELNHRAWFASLPYFSKTPEKIDQNKWQKFATFLQKNGMIHTIHNN